MNFLLIIDPSLVPTSTDASKFGNSYTKIGHSVAGATLNSDPLSPQEKIAILLRDVPLQLKADVIAVIPRVLFLQELNDTATATMVTFLREIIEAAEAPTKFKIASLNTLTALQLDNDANVTKELFTAIHNVSCLVSFIFFP